MGYAECRSWLDEKKSAPCADCGGRFPPECMDFDHLHGEVKLFEVGSGVSRKRAILQAEIAKCELVCANCHRIRTRKRPVDSQVSMVEWSKRGLPKVREY